MDCPDVMDSLEMYIAGDLPDTGSLEVAAHLAACETCTAEYDRIRELVGDLKVLASSFVPTERFTTSSSRARRGAAWGWRFATAAAVALALFSVSALAVPAIARQLPTPLGSALGELEQRNEDLQSQVDELSVRLESIGGEDVPVVDTAPGDLATDVNAAVQDLAMEFVRAQYARDLEALKAMSTDRLRAQMEVHPDEYLRAPGATVVFAQMTEAAQADDGTLLVFVRIQDSAEWTDSQYQEDFEIKLIDGEYLVDFMGMDA